MHFKGRPIYLHTVLIDIYAFVHVINSHHLIIYNVFFLNAHCYIHMYIDIHICAQLACTLAVNKQTYFYIPHICIYMQLVGQRERGD